MRNARFDRRSFGLAVYCAALVLLILPVPASSAALSGAARQCERVIGRGLARCFDKISRELNSCYAGSGAPCPSATFTRELDTLQRRIVGGCSQSAIAELEYGPQITVPAIVARVREACRGDAEALAARTFGGPHGAALAGATPAGAQCLQTAATRATRLIRKAYSAQSNCVRRARHGTCRIDRLDADLQAERAAALSAIDGDCTNLTSLIGINSSSYAERALAQTRCMVATVHADPAPLSLDCGARPEVPPPPRGQWVRVVLPESEWGTRCGNGSSYAFWLRLAPPGGPLEKVVIDLQGGGVCTNENECLAVPLGRFVATDSQQPSGGYMSTNPAVNPFHDWTMLALAYCNQDVYAGGGNTSVFPGISVARFGAINTQTSLRYLRDVLWQALDADTAEGYRPDRLRVLFGGVSAGGFGVSYNYHYVLDDLRWASTTAVPDAALGLNNGSLQGVAGLGILMIGTVTGWGGLPFQPPYCLPSICSVVPHRNVLTSPRLKRTPWQQILTVSNQVDSTQRATTFFSSNAAWTNAARQSYCNVRGRTGLRYFLPANSASLHGFVGSDTRFTTMTSDGVTLRDWLAGAINDPDNVVDLVEEGTLTTTNAGVNPFPCQVD